MNNYLSADQQRLLGGWRDVVDDIRALCRNLAELPEGCDCGQGEAHLKGACPCCHTTAVEVVPSCNDCDAQLARLRPAIDLLVNDTTRFFPVVRELVNQTAPPELRARVGTIETHIAELVRSFGDLVVAADQFRSDCRTSHLQTVKDLASALLRESDGFSRAL